MEETVDNGTTRPWHGEYGPDIDAAFPGSRHPNLTALVRSAARAWGERPAFSMCLDNGLGATLDFASVDRLSDRFAAYLEHELGIEPGARVAIQTPNALGYPVCAFGVLKAGAVLVNVNPLYTAPEMRSQLSDSGARVLVIADLFADKLEEGLSGTDVRHVVTLSLADFFPALTGTLVRTVLRYVKRLVPRPTAPVTPLSVALQRVAKGPAPTGAGERARSGDVALLQYTGGTTGIAKGAELTHGNLLANIAQIRTVAADALRPGEDVVLTALPLYHIFAFTFNLLTFHDCGCHNVLCPSPRPPSNLKRAFAKYPITKFSGVNALFQGLLREDWFQADPPRSIDLTIAGGTALNPQIAEQWRSLVGSPICEGYGLSETSPVVCVNPPAGEVRVGTIGVPLPGTDVRLLDEFGQPVADGEAGELAVRGPQVMRGYWQRPGETRAVMADGWFRTGDVARTDERGYFRIVDRRKDMIDVNGFNVYPNEVEACLDNHPDIEESAVIGRRNDDGSERVCAFVVTRNLDLAAEDVIAWARRSLTAYKVPREIIFRDELPKTPVGKILRKDLRADTGAGR